MHLAKLDACRATDHSEPLAKQAGELRNFLHQLSNLEVRVRASPDPTQDLLDKLADRQAATKAEIADLEHRLRMEAPAPELPRPQKMSCTLSDVVLERFKGLSRRLQTDHDAQRMAKLRAAARRLDEQQAAAAKAAPAPRVDLAADLARVRGALSTFGSVACDWSAARAAIAANADAVREQHVAWRSLQTSVSKIRADMTEEQAFFTHLEALYGQDLADLRGVELELRHLSELQERIDGLVLKYETLDVRMQETATVTETKAMDWSPVVLAIADLRGTKAELDAMLVRLSDVSGERHDFASVLRDMHHQFAKWTRFQDAMGKCGESEHIDHDHLRDHVGKLAQ